MSVSCLPVAPTTAFSPLSPVQKADLERVLRVDLTGSASRRRMAGVCALPTSDARKGSEARKRMQPIARRPAGVHDLDHNGSRSATSRGSPHRLAAHDGA